MERVASSNKVGVEDEKLLGEKNKRKNNHNFYPIFSSLSDYEYLLLICCFRSFVTAGILAKLCYSCKEYKSHLIRLYAERGRHRLFLVSYLFFSSKLSASWRREEGQ
jgi:hypothetical protein